MNYKILYPEIPNMGDLLNKDMLEELFHIQVERGTYFNSNMSAIGSGLYKIQWANRLSKKMIKQMIYYPLVQYDYHVWGTGFLRYPDKKENAFYFPKMHFHCLRGKLSQNRVEAIIHKKLDVPLADGGLLAERWAGEQEKKYDIGIIPHFRERDHHLVKKMQESYDNSIVINLKEDPKTVVKTIASCKHILSSSLHGLIVSDSYHIPNMHIRLYPMGERVQGDGFKFADYYSSYGLEDKIYALDINNLPSTKDIEAAYRIDAAEVEKKKNQLISAFPR